MAALIAQYLPRILTLIDYYRAPAPKGAKYNSQGQAPNKVRRVAPGNERIIRTEHWKCEISTSIIPLFQSFTIIVRAYQGRRASRCSALAPGYHIPRLRRCRTLWFHP